MKDELKNKYANIIDLDSVKEFCDNNMMDIVNWNLRLDKNLPKVRFINSSGEFGYTNISRIFFFLDCMYILVGDEKYESEHNPDISNASEVLSYLNYSSEYVVRVIFAGLFTGYYDDDDKRIFTGDVVDIKAVLDPKRYSLGGRDRAVRSDNEGGASCVAGVYDFFGAYSVILDNHHIPLSWATNLKVVGSFFYDLKPGETEVDIRRFCNQYAQYREDRNELRTKIQNSPNFRKRIS